MGIFTGLIMELGSVKRFEKRSDGATIQISASKVLEGTKLCDSISLNGVDITVVEMSSSLFRADISNETLKLTTLGELHSGKSVNLERALALGERFGGHMVQGHIDGTGEFTWSKHEGNSRRMRFQFKHELARYIAMKGSIAIDGIALTVAGLGENWLEAVIVPHTWDETTLSDLRPGDKVNLEVDVLAKYVERLMQYDREAHNDSKNISLEYLTERGF